MKKIKKIWIFIMTLSMYFPISVLAVEDYGYEGEAGGSFNLTIGLSIVFIALMFFVIFKEAFKAKKNVNLNSMDSDVDSKIIEGSEREHVEHIEILDNNYDDVIDRHIPGYDEEKLLDELYKSFCLVEEALISHEQDVLKRICSSTLYSEYVNEEVEGIHHFKLVDSAIRNIEEDDGVVVIDMYLCVSLGEVHKKFDLEFIASKKNDGICGRCGATLGGEFCEYCQSRDDNRTHIFILNKKSNISD